MVIRRSSAREVALLVHDLETGTAVEREAAVARLSVIGTRAVGSLLALLASGAAARVKAGALAALEPVADPRAASPALACLEGGETELLGPAAAVLRRLLETSRGTQVLDRLAALALDAGRPDGVRLAALDALRNVPAATLAPIRKRLRDDPSVAVRGAAGAGGTKSSLPPLEALERAAAEGSLPDDPSELRQWLAAEGTFAPLPALHRLVELVREREGRAGDAAERGAWMTARAAIHQALAARGSTVALYDLRETIESGQAPVEILAALEAIGGRGCLESIAAAYARLSEGLRGGAAATADSTAWWREHLVAVFRTIASRERLSERHAVAKRIRARWPDAASVLLGSQSGPSPSSSSSACR